MWVAGAMALFTGVGVAAAQESNPSTKGMPQGSEGMPQNACPPGTSPVYQTPGQMGGQMNAQPMAPSTSTTVIVPGAPGYAEQERERERTRPKWSPGQVSLSVGGGVADFVRTRINDRTGTAGTWDAKLTVGTRSYAAFEATCAARAIPTPSPSPSTAARTPSRRPSAPASPATSGATRSSRPAASTT